MPRWKPRDPSIFPPHYATCVELAYKSKEPHLLQSCRTTAGASKLRNIFREWRFCLREKGRLADRGFEIERDYRICTFTRAENGMIGVWVEIRPRVLSSLAKLNPDLDIPT